MSALVSKDLHVGSTRTGAARNKDWPRVQHDVAARKLALDQSNAA
jgi:hypothetical protein